MSTVSTRPAAYAAFLALTPAARVAAAARLAAQLLAVEPELADGLLDLYRHDRADRAAEKGYRAAVARLHRVVRFLRDRYGLDEPGDWRDGTTAEDVVDRWLGRRAAERCRPRGKADRPVVVKAVATY